MKREKRKVTPAILGLFGAKAYIEYQPKGVIGVISPWNFPFNLTFTPLAGIFAAGNRVMIKPSEFTPRCSELMARMFRSAYDETEVAVFTGGPEVGAAFSQARLRPSAVHRRDFDRLSRAARGGGESGADDAGTRRQVACHRRRRPPI